MPPPNDPAFGLELIKLLLQVAAADHDVHQLEAEVMLRLARHWALPQAEVDELTKKLRSPVGLPPPNMAVLRANPSRVLEGIRFLAKVDGGTSEDESAMIEEVETLLGAKLPP